MLPTELPRVGYVLKCYPRYSETFIVTEILAHEAAGLPVEIFSLRPPTDGHFQDIISQVRAPVCYLPEEAPRVATFWAALEEASRDLPDLWSRLAAARGEAGRDVYQAVLLAREVRRRGIDHLHAHFGTVATSVARLAAHLAGVPYTFTAHAKDIFHEAVDPDDLRRKLRDAAATITVSAYNLAYLRAAYAADAAAVVHLYNGLNLDLFPFAPADERPPRIVSVGRLVEKKGLPDLIDACALLARRGHQVDCQIVGGGPLEEELRARITGHGLEGRVELLGPRPQRQVARLVQEAAVFVAPCVVGSDSNRDGLPTVLLEAMALGTPCVATDVTGIPEVVRDGETGLLVPQHAPKDLAAAIERLVAEPATRARLALNARRLIETGFDSRRNSARQREVFQTAARASVMQEVM
jgi:colanic acid/amylovoran biosynthesis glycosyltransferase